MKFKATSDFRNTHKFKVDGRKAGNLPTHIAKGETFEADVEDAKTAEVIAILGHSGRVVDVENQPDSGKKIDAEVEAANKKAVDAAKIAEAASKE